MNKLFEIALDVSYLTDKLKFYIKLRDIIRHYKVETMYDEQRTSNFRKDMKKMETNRHIMTKRTLKLYTTLVGEVHIYRFRGNEQLQFIDTFKKLEENIEEELNKIYKVIWFYNKLRYVMLVLVIAWLIGIINSNLFSR